MKTSLHLLWFALMFASAVSAWAEEPSPLSLPKPAATTSDEPIAKSLSLARAGEYLDRSAMAWLRERECASCHSSYSYLMARPMLGDAKAPALLHMRKYVEDRVASWDRGS